MTNHKHVSVVLATKYWGVSNNINKIHSKSLIFLGEGIGVMVNILVIPCSNTMLADILYKQVKFKLLLKQIKRYVINCLILRRKIIEYKMCVYILSTSFV